MKIAILTPTFSSFSGIDRVAELQARELSKKNKVTIMTLKAGLRPPAGVNLIELGLPKNPTIERLYRLLFFLDFNKIRKASKMLEDYDLVISHNYPTNLIALKAKKLGAKYRYHNHGVAFPHLFSKFGERVYLRVFNWLNNRTIKNSDEAVSISEFLRDILRKETGIESKVEYDKVDSERFNKKVSGKTIREKYSLGKAPVLLYVGRISPHKGTHYLLQAFKLIRKKVPDARLIIVGKHTFQKYSTKLKSYADDGVIFAGHVPDEDLPGYYGACDVYATCTRWEGFNLTVAEANACGKPVIAFDIGPHREVIKKGVVVPEKDIKAFAKETIDLLGHSK